MASNDPIDVLSATVEDLSKALSESIRMAKDNHRRLSWLAGVGVDFGPIFDGFGECPDFYAHLGEVMEERLGLAGRDIDEEPTDEDKLNAFCRMIDAAMAKAVSDA